MARALAHTLVIGIGNPDRGDDAAGRVAAQRLRGNLSAGVEITEHDGEATSLLALLDGVDTAILIDACSSGAPAGTVRRFDVVAAPLPRVRFNISTHGPGLADAIELARALGQMPQHCVVYAIEADSFEVGDALSPPVAAAIAALTARIRAEADSAVGVERWRHA